MRIPEIQAFASVKPEKYNPFRCMFDRNEFGVVMPQILTIELPGGMSLDIDQDQWEALANPVHASLLEDGAVEQLIVQTNKDRETLVYAVIKRPERPTIVGGELLPPGSTDIESAVRRVGESYSLWEGLVEGCLTKLRPRPN
jgi:hypothetical protein